MKFIMLHKKMILVVSTAVFAMLLGGYAALSRSVFSGSFDILFFIIMALCGLAIYVVSFILLFYKEWPIHKLFLVAGSAIGLLSLVINTPGSIPDEAAHIKNAYLLSNRLLGIHDTVSAQQASDVYINYTSSIRKEDLKVFTDIVDGESSLQTYREIATEFKVFAAPGDAALVDCDFRDNSISPVAYFPAILGITAARLLHLGGVPLLYLSKLFMLAFYIWGIYWAIKRLPLGKLPVFIIAIMPMCVHLAPSFSYDAVIITFAFMLIAHVLYLAYGDIRSIGRKELIISCLLVFLFTPLKIMIYLPIVLLFFMIPKTRFPSKSRAYIFCFGMLFLGVASIIVFNLSVVLTYTPGQTLTNQYVNAGQPAYTAAWLWQHPVNAVSLILNTTIKNGVYYYITMVGGLLGRLDTPVTHKIIYGFALCLIAACLSERSQEAVVIKTSHRIVFVVLAASTYLFVLIGMTIWWTPFGTDVIQGVQGRYFIPVLPLLIFALYGLRHFKVANGFGQVIAMISIALTLFAFPNMLMTILSR